MGCYGEHCLFWFCVQDLHYLLQIILLLVLLYLLIWGHSKLVRRVSVCLTNLCHIGGPDLPLWCGDGLEKMFQTRVSHVQTNC